MSINLGDGNELVGAKITSIEHSSKQAIHQYDWSDECAVTDMGHGPTTIQVEGICTGTTNRYNIDGYVEAARTTETELQFPSVNGTAADYYFKVYCSPCRWTPLTATVYQYQFTAIATVPWIYAISDDSRVT